MEKENRMFFWIYVDFMFGYQKITFTLKRGDEVYCKVDLLS